eukprot:5692155-Pleurochrysis_carterae.AAC.1
MQCARRASRECLTCPFGPAKMLSAAPELARGLRKGSPEQGQWLLMVQLQLKVRPCWLGFPQIADLMAPTWTLVQ